MPRIRTIFNAQTVYAGPTPATGAHFVNAGNPDNSGDLLVKQLHRIQSTNLSISQPKQDVYQQGQLAALDRIGIDSPVVSFEMSYLLANLYNERVLGFTVSSGVGGLVSAISDIITKEEDDKNYFAKVVPEGNDSIGYNEDFVDGDNPDFTAAAIPKYHIWGFGNMHITSYSAEFSVGDFPRASVSCEGLNAKIDFLTGESIPAVNPTDGSPVTAWRYTLPNDNIAEASYGGGTDYSVLRPGDISIDVGYNDGGVDTSDWKIQSASLSMDIGREPIQTLGTKYAISREIGFPVNANFQVTAIVGDVKSGNFADILACDKDYDLEVRIAKPDCDVEDHETNLTAIFYKLKGANLESQEYSLDIQGNKTVTMNFICPIGGPQDQNHGIFFSGIN